MALSIFALFLIFVKIALFAPKTRFFRVFGHIFDIFRRLGGPFFDPFWRGSGEPRVPPAGVHGLSGSVLGRPWPTRDLGGPGGGHFWDPKITDFSGFWGVHFCPDSGVGPRNHCF
jgi:hypothetical protein